MCRVSWKPAMATELSSSTMGEGLTYPSNAPVISGDHLGATNFKMRYALPAGVTCDHCVVRWHYFTTNSCSSSGSRAEDFWNCADIAIEGASGTTRQTAVSANELSTLVTKLLHQAPVSTALRGDFTCASFGRQGDGNPSWAYTNAGTSAASYRATLYGEFEQPGYTTGCLAHLGSEGCLFLRSATISFWNTGESMAPTQVASTSSTPTTDAPTSATPTTSAPTTQVPTGDFPAWDGTRQRWMAGVPPWVR